MRRICSDYDDFRQKSRQYCKYLIDCAGMHNSEHVLRMSILINGIGNRTRQEARRSKCKIGGRSRPPIFYRGGGIAFGPPKDNWI
jgi:hypothetical protein